MVAIVIFAEFAMELSGLPLVLEQVLESKGRTTQFHDQLCNVLLLFNV
jgi:hypothetical protein